MTPTDSNRQELHGQLPGESSDSPGPATSPSRPLGSAVTHSPQEAWSSPSPTSSPLTTSPSDPSDSPQSILALIPLRLIVTPEDANPRLHTDPDADAELARSIARNGLLNPITVRRVGQLYELVAGSRRLAAHRALGKTAIRATVVEADDHAAADARFAENLDRSNLTPIEEAACLSGVVQSGTSDIEAIAKRTGRSREWVEDRLALLGYPPTLQQAIHEGLISLAAASWLAQITPTEECDRHVHMAVGHGISASTARLWLQQHQTHAATVAATPPGETPPPAPPVVYTANARCHFCKRDVPLTETAAVRSCAPCLDQLQRALDAAGA